MPGDGGTERKQPRLYAPLENHEKNEVTNGYMRQNQSMNRHFWAKQKSTTSIVYTNKQCYKRLAKNAQ